MRLVHALAVALLLVGVMPQAVVASQGPTDCSGFVLTPAPGANIEKEDLHSSWHPVEGVGGYRVEVARESNFAVPSFRVEGMRKPEYAATLPAGHYYWRVSAADGPFRGPTCDFSIV